MSTNQRLTAYGLQVLLTEADDPDLWEAALNEYWPAVDDPSCLLDALRFDIGRRLAENEAPQGETNDLHAKMRGMVDIEEWCFERVDADHLRITKCAPITNTWVSYLPGLVMSGIPFGQTSVPPPAQVVFVYLGITRPSRAASQAVVYSGTSMPGAGEGKALLWQRLADGQWKPTDQRVAWWIT